MFGFPYSTDQVFILRTILLNAVFFPLITLSLMKALGFIESYQLPDRQQRILVLIAVCVYYIWAFTVFLRTEYHEVLSDLMLGASIGVSLALVVDSVYERISWHTLGMGGLVAISIYTARELSITNILPHVGIIVICAGLAGTARLWLGVHTPQNIWKGYVYGFLCMAIPLFI